MISAPRRHGLPRHARFRGVDRDDDAGLFAQRLDDADHASQLVVFTDRCRIRSGTFAADIQDIGPLLDQPQSLLDGGLVFKELATVRKTVGGHIDDAHQQGHS